MAGVTGHRDITNGLFQMLMDAEKGIKNDAQEAALEAAIAGEDAVRWTIDNTPSAIVPGKTNRNWTFQMRQAVDSKVNRNGNTITIRVGWTGQREGYFLIQEHGLGTITPMNALMNGHKAVLDTLKGWGIKPQ